MTAEPSVLDWGVLGQEHAVGALRHAMEDGRLAHSYLFVGPRGVGRATLARRLAQALCCEAPHGIDPCFECRACRQIEAGDWPDVERISVGGVCDEREHRDHAADGSTRVRICQVRRLQRVATLAPLRSAYRIFVIDTADDLQIEAAQALLKTLEEPPAAALLILLASDVQELLPTVRSRCQEIVLRPLPRPTLEAALRSAGADEETVAEVAQLAGGRYGLAQQLLRDPSLRVLREATREEIERLLPGTRNERFDYASTLARRWGKERESVLATLDIWREWCRETLQRIASGDSESTGWTPREAVLALRAVQVAREHLLDNTNPQLALEVMLLGIPRARARADYSREGDRLASTQALS